MSITKSLARKRRFFAECFGARLSRKKICGDAVAVIQLAGMGDAALLAPFVRALGKRSEKVTMICPAGLKSFWKYFFPGMEIIAVSEKYSLDQAPPEELLNLKRRNIARAYCFSVPRNAVYAASLIRKANKYAYWDNDRSFSRGKFIFDAVYEQRKGEHIHDRFLNTIRLGESDFDVDFSPFANSPGDGRIALHPGAKWKPRRWMPERWLELAKRLVEQGKKVELLVGSFEEDLFEYFSKEADSGGFKVYNPASLEDFFDRIKTCSLFVGNDSGPAHVANLFGRNTLVLWGPGEYERIRPLGERVHIIKKHVDCRPCRQYIYPDRCERGENVCLRRISTDEVFAAAMNLSIKV